MGTITRSFANLITASGPSAVADGSISAGDLATGVGGKVLQVVTDTLTTNFSTTSQTYTDITGLSVSITPSSASNKILILVNLCSCRSARSDTSCNIFFNLVRSSTELTASRLNYFDNATNNLKEIDGTVNFMFLDSPNTTSSTTYKCQVKTEVASGTTAQVNQLGSNNAVSSITVMEIAG